MIRKWLTVLLSLLLAMALPLAALADTQHTLTIIPGDDMTAIPAVADLFDVLAFTVTPGEKAGALTLTVDDTDIATIAMSADTTGLYVQSDLLSDDVLYVTWDDAFAFLTQVMISAMEAEGEEVDAATRKALETGIEQYKAALLASLGSADAAASFSPTTYEEAREMVSKMFADDPKMMEYVEGIYDKMVIENGSFTDDERDPADQKYTLTLGNEDLLKVCDSNYMRDLMTSAISSEDSSLSEAEVAKKVDEALAEVRKMYSEGEFQMDMTMYTANAGETLIGMEMGMIMKIASGDDSVAMTMNTNYDRLTSEAGVSHKGDMGIVVDEDDNVQLLLDLNKGSDGITTGLAGMMVDDEALTVTVNAKPIGTDGRERMAAIYLREEATAIIAPAASERPLITFKVTSGPADGDKLSVIEKATPDNSVNVMKLSAEEMEALVADISGRCMQALYTAMGKLPASVLNTLFSTGAEPATTAD